MIDLDVQRELVGLAASAFCLLSMWRLSGHHRDGWAWAFGSVVGWIWFSILIASPVSVAFQLCLAAVNVRGWRRWSS